MTGAAGQIAYSLLYGIAKGDVFGKDQVNAGPSLHVTHHVNSECFQINSSVKIRV